MNTPTFSRRLALGLLLGLTTLGACKKEADVTPKNTDLGAQAAGRYTLTELSANGKTIPAAQADLKGTITISRQTETSANMVFDIREKSTNEEVIVGEADGLLLSGSGDAISFKGDNEEVATLKGNKLSIAVADNSGTNVTFIATK